MYKFSIIILLILSVKNVCSQNWEQTLSVENHNELRDIIEDYDRGTLLLSLIYNNNNESSTLLTKHDINGNVLWSQTIGNLEDRIYSNTVKALKDGSIIIGGGEDKLSNTTNSFILKLDPCGDLEWLKVIGEEVNEDFITDILILNDGNILVQATNLGNERVSLIKMTVDGEELWRKDYLGGEIQPSIGFYNGVWLSSIAETEDNGFILCGNIFTLSPSDTTTTYSRTFVLKTDDIGNQEWVYVYGLNDTMKTQSADVLELNGGYIVHSTLRLPGNIFTEVTGLSHLFKVDKNGNFLWDKTVGDTSVNTFTDGMSMLNDSVIYLTTNSQIGNPITGTDYHSYIKIFKTDTFGNIMDTANYGKGVDINTQATSLSKTKSHKILVGGFQDSANFRSAYYLRIQEDLSIDTFTNEILNYDTLCNKTITDSFIAFDTAVSIIDFGALEYELKVYPNPVSKFIYFEIEDLENVAYTLSIYDIEGKLIKRKENVKESFLKLNLEDLKIGNYFYTLEYHNRNIAEGKFVKF